jgi:hypothetical protein
MPAGCQKKNQKNRIEGGPRIRNITDFRHQDYVCHNINNQANCVIKEKLELSNMISLVNGPIALV